MSLSIVDHTALIQAHRDQRACLALQINVAERLHRLRILRQLSVDELAEATGLNKRQLQKIEGGTTSPTISVLQRLLGALGTGFADFFAMKERQACLNRRVITSRGHGRECHLADYHHRLLSTELMQKKMLPMTSKLQTVDGLSHSQWAIHEGEAFVLVLTGRVEMMTEHYQSLLLEQGDSVYFDCNMRYRLHSDQQSGAEIVWLTSMS